jgi:hypothetical protein
MGWQHAVCAAKYASHMLRQIKQHPEQAGELAKQALEMLGVDHLPDDAPLVYWRDGDDG